MIPFFKKRDTATDKKIGEATPVQKFVRRTSAGSRGLPGVLIRPHITEKTSAGASRAKYAFSVARGATKAEIKHAVEGRWGVSVVAINVLNMPGKTHRRGKQIGRRPGLRKAVVTLTEGQVIEIE